MDIKTVCTCNGEVHDECRPCADCDQTPALNDVVDDPDGGVMYLCDDCYEERVEAEEQRIAEQREAERPLTRQQQDWFDAIIVACRTADGMSTRRVDDNDHELRPVRLMLLIPALFIIGCVLEAWLW